MQPFDRRFVHCVAGIVAAGCLAWLAPGGGAAEPSQPKPKPTKPAIEAFTDPANVDADFRFQGEYAGTLAASDGTAGRLGLQVRALGDGNFRTMFFAGGLPGDGWDGKTIIQKEPSTDAHVPTDSTRDGDQVIVDQVYKATLDGRTARGQTDAGVAFTLQRVDRKSPTLGTAPPAGAVVLFDGTNTDQWQPGAQLVPGNLLMSGATTQAVFNDFFLHAEFMIAYAPKTQGIGQRPNSGIYLQRRYEIQILDSFGVVMGKHDCGVLYAQITPEINMCYPPLAWQTYDIGFTAVRYDPQGQKSQLARTTVKLNGVTILDDVEILHSTPGGIPESPEPAGLLLQRHGLAVLFRNLWLVERK